MRIGENQEDLEGVCKHGDTGGIWRDCDTKNFEKLGRLRETGGNLEKLGVVWTDWLKLRWMYENG